MSLGEENGETGNQRSWRDSKGTVKEGKRCAV